MPFKKPAAAGTIALLLLLPLAAWSGGVVTNCTEADLRAAMVGGGTVSFACDGTITLASTITNDIDITIDGTGHQVTVSGGNTVRVFFINPNVALTLINLSVANGHSPGVGMWPAEAGGILNLGNLNATSCTFRENFAEGQNGTYPDPGVTAHGGAILNLNGAKLNLSRCSFLMNRATGGHGADGLDGSFASAPTGGSAGGPARGGAICNAGAMDNRGKPVRQ